MLSDPSLLKHDVPTIFTHEFSSASKFINSEFKFLRLKHNLNGGCTNLRLCFGFKNMPTLVLLSPMKCGLGGFLDYSTDPTTSIDHSNIGAKLHLTKECCLTYHTRNNAVALPTYRFSTGWGLRNLTNREYCNVWGLSELENANVDITWVLSIAPTQVASLIIASYFSSNLVPAAVPSLKLRSHSPIHPSNTTTFHNINVTIPHDWIDNTVVLSATRKADNAPVPASLWDRRIMASFPDRPVNVELLSLFRRVGLSFYRKRLRRSFVSHLRQECPDEWSAFLGKIKHTNVSNTPTTVGGKKSEFQKTLEAGVDVLLRADNATWFEWNGGSALIFWRWHDFKGQARDGFPTHFLETQLRLTPKKNLNHRCPRIKMLKH